MRFLKAIVAKETGTLEVVEKDANQIPLYAILSHTWEEDEVKFEDIESGRVKDVSLDALRIMTESSPFKARSLSKIRHACIQAANDGYEYIWIDSCCIDKRSSTELSEAINSMFAWYRAACVCYAFLLYAPDCLDTRQEVDRFSANRWFQRGFTLQELLAPMRVIFFSGRWVPIGEKRTRSRLLAKITGIDEDILRGNRPLVSASVARRMSWAAKRVTTRPEDSAYCLMGIFSVHMPMLYGEGAERAFIRLQEEIMKQSDDQSLFAWTAPDLPPDATVGLLASSPSYFLHSNGISSYQDWEPRSPYAVTNRGLKIDLHLTTCGNGIYKAALDCPVPPDYKDSSFLALYLFKLSDGDEQYARVKVDQLTSVVERGHLQTVFIRQKPQPPSPEGAYPHHFIQLCRGPPINYSLIRILYPANSDSAALPRPIPMPSIGWVPTRWPFVFPMRKKPAQLSVALVFLRNDGERLAVMIGTKGGFDIAFNIRRIDSKVDAWMLTFEYMESIFNASKGRNKFKNEYHRVIVSTTPVIQSSFKYYLVHIDFTAPYI